MSLSVNSVINRLHLSPAPARIPGSDMWCCQIVLTPKLAADWLEKYNNKNRKKRGGRIDKTTSDMANGRWILTHQAIGFDTDGEMTSGQHRCESVVKSGVDIDVLITINCAPEERCAIDQTAGRSIKDVGLLGHGDDLNSLLISSAIAMARGFETDNVKMRPTPQETYEFIQTHRKALEFVHEPIKKRIIGITVAPVLAALARGYSHVKRADLKSFLGVLLSGVSESPIDRVIIDLRDQLVMKRAQMRVEAGRYLAYSLTQQALKHYCSGELPPKGLKPAKEELYPLPAVKYV